MSSALPLWENVWLKLKKVKKIKIPNVHEFITRQQFIKLLRDKNSISVVDILRNATCPTCIFVYHYGKIRAFGEIC